MVTHRATDRAILVGLRLPRQKRWEVEESMEELARLAQSAGAEVLATVLQEREAPTPPLHFGRGKVEEIRDLARSLGANLLVSDDPLTPVQERNVGRAVGVRVIDRTALILDIFAQRARTSEGKLQVELAQLTYLLPRLVGQWAHLERLGGGIGTRGPGETQLESDRRVIRRRIAQIHAALRDVQRHRRLLREHRRDVGLPVVALVGYTNAGKTTLLNRLAGASGRTADQLFVTLDPAARLAHAPGRAPFLLTDTVGFIQKLPTQVVAAFKATLEELGEADLLLHVMDVSHPRAREQMAAVGEVLRELGLETKPSLTVVNKVDRVVEGDGFVRQMESEGGVPISARLGTGVERLLRRIDEALRGTRLCCRLKVPYDRVGVVSSVYARGQVLRREDGSDGIRLDVEIPRALAGLVEPYRDETVGIVSTGGQARVVAGRRVPAGTRRVAWQGGGSS
ncbi:MAG TPA: GTPase HflX [Methylomirabilota bacterium]|nr:GTPase HflX [Methylomirabilota bacterium]